MTKKIFLIVLVCMISAGSLFAEKGDLKLSIVRVTYSRIGGINAEYSFTSQFSAGMYFSDALESINHVNQISVDSVRMPVTFGIITGWDFLRSESQELFLGTQAGYGFNTYASDLSPAQSTTSFYTSLLLRYSHTFPVGLFVGAYAGADFIFNAYDWTSNLNNKIPVEIGPAYGVFFGWKIPL